RILVLVSHPDGPLNEPVRRVQELLPDAALRLGIVEFHDPRGRVRPGHHDGVGNRRGRGANWLHYGTAANGSPPRAAVNEPGIAQTFHGAAYGYPRHAEEMRQLLFGRELLTIAISSRADGVRQHQKYLVTERQPAFAINAYFSDAHLPCDPYVVLTAAPR